METEGLDATLRGEAFFAGMDAAHIELLAGCARHHRFDAGRYLFHEGEAADEFFVLRHGRVALEVGAAGRAPLVIATLGPGDIVGASWLVPPYRWSFDARAIELVRAVGIDAACLRRKCDADHGFGYTMMQRFLPLLVRRMQAARMQLLDLYASR